MYFAKKHFTDSVVPNCGHRKPGGLRGDSWVIKGASGPWDFIPPVSVINNDLPGAYAGHAWRWLDPSSLSWVSKTAAQMVSQPPPLPLPAIFSLLLQSDQKHKYHHNTPLPRLQKLPIEYRIRHKVFCRTTGPSMGNPALAYFPASFLPIILSLPNTRVHLLITFVFFSMFCF